MKTRKRLYEAVTNLGTAKNFYDAYDREQARMRRADETLFDFDKEASLLEAVKFAALAVPRPPRTSSMNIGRFKGFATQNSLKMPSPASVVNPRKSLTSAITSFRA